MLQIFLKIFILCELISLNIYFLSTINFCLKYFLYPFFIIFLFIFIILKEAKLDLIKTLKIIQDIIPPTNHSAEQMEASEEEWVNSENHCIVYDSCLSSFVG